MRRTSFTVSLILVLALLALGCPKKPKKPEVLPDTVATMTTATETTETTQTVASTTTDFPTTTEPEVAAEDIETLNERAQREGLIADAFFSYDASTLDDAAQQALTKSASYLREHPE